MKEITNYTIMVLLLLLGISASAQTELPKDFEKNVNEEYDRMTKEDLNEHGMSKTGWLDYQTKLFQERSAFFKSLSQKSGENSGHNLCEGGQFNESDCPNENFWDFLWGGTGWASCYPFQAPTNTRSNNGIFDENCGTHADLVHHACVSTGPDDLIGNLLNRVPAIPAGNTTALRLGNAARGKGYESMTKSNILITSDNASLTFYYALVMNDPTGDFNAKPHFAVNIINANSGQNHSNLVNLGNGSNQIASDNPLLIRTNIKKYGDTIVYKEWTCVNVDLSSLIGETVHIEFYNRDCTAGAHFGYTYLDNLCIGCPVDGPEGGIELDLGNTDDCGKGKICFNYTLPSLPNGQTGSLQIDLEIYQNGSLVSTFSSPSLSSGSAYCFNIDPAQISNINTSLVGFDFRAVGYPSINGFNLSPQYAGSLPFGQILGFNNDYLINCEGCWLENIKPNIDYTSIITGSVVNTTGVFGNGFIKIPNSIFINNNQMWNGTYYIPEGVTITVSNATLDLTNVDLIFGECSGIHFGPGAMVRANNSVFRPCDMNKTWNGFTFSRDAKGVINESTFKNAQIAVNLQNTGESSVKIVNNLFQNCRIGVGASGVVVMEGITGNTFNLDRNQIKYEVDCRNTVASYFNPIISGTYNNDHWGIVSLKSRFVANVSQNNFVNAQELVSNSNTTESAKYFYGILNYGGSMVASNNNFTDLYRSFDISNAASVSIENNNIDVNTYNYLGTTKSEHQIRINQSIGVSVNSNKLTCTFEDHIKDVNWDSHSAIYVERSSDISVLKNQIMGFETGIQSIGNQKILLKENSLMDVHYCGIYSRRSSNINVMCNNINMDDKFKKTNIGIYYQTLMGFPNRDRISGNCIFEAFTSVVLEGLNVQTCLPLPIFTNNFMYNYTNAGVDIIHLRGNIGTAGNARDGGRNTFASNNLSTGAVDISSNCAVQVDGNYGIFVTNGPINVGQNEFYSTASCGAQTPSDVNMLMDNYNETCDPIFLYEVNVFYGKDGRSKKLRDNFKEIINNMGEYDDLIPLWFNVLKDNSSDFLTLYNTLTQKGKHTQLVEYYFALEAESYPRALELISAVMSENDSKYDSNWESLQKATIELHQDWKLSTSTLESLKAMQETEQNRASYTQARQLLQIGGNGNDYPFVSISNYDKIEFTEKRVLDGFKMLLYPNPSSESVSIDFSINSKENATLKVMDIFGKIIIEQPLNNVQGVLNLDISGLRHGIYMFEISTQDGESISSKFLKF